MAQARQVKRANGANSKEARARAVATLAMPVEEKRAILERVDQYRAEHPRASMADTLKALGVNVSTASIPYWRKRFMGEESETSQTERIVEVEHFPLTVIPPRQPVERKPTGRAAHQKTQERELALELLETSTRLQSLALRLLKHQ